MNSAKSRPRPILDAMIKSFHGDLGPFGRNLKGML